MIGENDPMYRIYCELADLNHTMDRIADALEKLAGGERDDADLLESCRMADVDIVQALLHCTPESVQSLYQTVERLRSAIAKAEGRR